MKVTISEPWLKNTAAAAQRELAEGERERYWDDKLPGFGVVVGRRAISFVARHRVAGKRRDVLIGHWHLAGKGVGAGDDHGATWTEKRARVEARSLLGGMGKGVDPIKARATTAAGPTLDEAFDAHVASLEKKVKAGKRSQATIDTFLKSKKYVERWLDKPISALTGDALAELHEQIKRDAKPRANARNEKGAPLANRVIANVSAAWTTLNKKLAGALGNWNPAKSVDKDGLAPKRARVTDLRDWHARMLTMRSPIQRDGLMLALFTGLRSEDVRTIRHEHVDLEERVLHLPDPKGGPDAAFTIPLPKTCAEILERRAKDNVRNLVGDDEKSPIKSDAGWAFPAVNGDGEVGPISDLRQQVHEVIGEDDDGEPIERHTRFPAEDVHTLRRTYESVAQEEGISELDQHVLTNHSFGSHNVNATYIAQHIDHLAACADKIEAGLWKRIQDESPKTKRARGRMRSV
ncbi:MAG TPA: hypothetical protein VGL61_06445 [Kofleriaceae bacterium]|jgi:integrase